MNVNNDWTVDITRLFTDAGSYRLNVEPLTREHRDAQTNKNTEQIIYRRQQCDTRSGIIAGNINGVVKVYNTTMRRSCFIISYHIVIKYA